MSDWTGGYVTDVGYTFGYYTELNPARVTYPLLITGIVPPRFETACELGFGQGLSVNIHAAASPVRWFANDFNPTHANFAQSLASASGANATLTDEAFAEFTARSDLPDFDYIGLHGIWSWISDDNRRAIADFVRRKLRVGGILYVSYNTLPGWAAMMPVRHLMAEHAHVMGANGRGIVARIDGALEFAEKLLAANPMYARANPSVAERFKRLKEQNRNYLAHEYFNRDWEPMYFSKMAEWLSLSKLQFAGSAHYLDHLDAINLSAEHQAVLKDITDPVFRQTVRDYCVNQQFRRDYWIKGGRRLTAMQQGEEIRAQRFVLALPRADVALKSTASLGEVSLAESVYNPILDAMADHKPRTLGEIEKLTQGKGLTFPRLVQAILLLAGKGDLAPVQPDEAIATASVRTRKLNAHLLDLARSAADINYLASPVTGGGAVAGRIQQLLLLARMQGRKTADEGAKFVRDIAFGQGQKMVKEGKTIESPEERLAELKAQAEQFESKQLPILRALGIA